VTNIIDLVNLVSFALTIQSKIILYLLAATSVLFVGLILILLLKRHLKTVTKDNLTTEKRRQLLRHASFGLLWASVGLTLASAIAISQTTSAMGFVTQDETVSAFQITAGKTLSVLQWLIFSFSALFSAGVSSIFPKQGGVIGSAGNGMAMDDGSIYPAPPLHLLSKRCHNRLLLFEIQWTIRRRWSATRTLTRRFWVVSIKNVLYYFWELRVHIQN